MLPPTFKDIVAAREFISPYLPKTPLVRVAKLSEELGCDYYVKLENLLPTGAFKVRGGVNLVGNEVSSASGRVTLVSASTGNHGQSIAFAGRLFGARVMSYAPSEYRQAAKLQAMRGLCDEIR